MAGYIGHLLSNLFKIKDYSVEFKTIAITFGIVKALFLLILVLIPKNITKIKNKYRCNACTKKAPRLTFEL